MSERYELGRLLGAGAMGEVLLAQDQALGREVAYKRLHGQMAASAPTLRRFVQEAQITAQLDHPNIVPIYHLEQLPDGQIAYTMKPIAGQTLKELMATAREQYATNGKPDRQHTLETLLGYFLKVCDAMHFAHSKGVIHRDLKPANLMIGPYGEVYVMDWGIAKVFAGPPALSEGLRAPESGPEPVEDQEATFVAQPAGLQAAEQELANDQTQLGQILGTLRYMSPQQAAGHNQQLDGHSDQFSLGLILFEIVTLKPAIRGKSQMDVIKAILGARLEACVHVQPKVGIPRELRGIIAKATAQKPAGRYADVAALAADLRRYLRGEAVQAQPDTLWQAQARWLAQHPRLALLLVAGALLLSAGLVGTGLYRAQQSEKAARYHASRLSELLLRNSEHSQYIDRVLLQSAGILRALAATTVESLVYGPELPARQPAGSEPLTLRADPAARAELGKMQGMLPDLQKFFLLGPALGGEPLPPLQAQRKLQTEGSALASLEIRLDQGLRLMYRQALFVAGPDWLRAPNPAGDFSSTQRGEFWTLPYLERGVPMLACRSGLFDYAEKRLGYAQITLSLDYLLRRVLPQTLPGLQETYLLDRQGRVLSRNQTMAQSSADFEIEALRLAARQQQSGYLETGASLYLYRPLPSLGWLYLVQLDAHELEQP